MNIFIRHIRQVIQSFGGQQPLEYFLKTYFRQNPMLGSRDRKAITEAVYLYYRCAAFVEKDTDPISVIRYGLVWCESSDLFLKQLIERETEATTTENKAPDFINTFSNEVFSNGVNRQEWLNGILKKRAVFIRVHKNIEQNLELLTGAGVDFDKVKDIKTSGGDVMVVLRIPGKTKLEPILPAADYVVQDLSSQELILEGESYLSEDFKKESHQVWDVCAGAGGKSILWKMLYPKDRIFATDVRKSILWNMKERLRLYGIEGVKTAVLDVRHLNMEQHSDRFFDVILCDVPCSGSGTWGRNPDRFFFFNQEKTLSKFEQIQFPITFQAQKRLKPGGYLFYMTCSVFRKENEQLVEKLLNEASSLIYLEQKTITHPEHLADTLFIAVFRKRP